MVALGVTTAVLLLLGSSGRVVSLDEALESGDRHQPNLRAAHADTDAARARADEARAGLLPQLNLGATYRIATAGSFDGRSLASDGGSTVGSTGAPGTATFGTNGLTLSATGSQLLWDFGQTFNRWRAQVAMTEATAQTEHATFQGVRYNVRSAYFNARAQKALVRVAHETLANEDKHLTQIAAFVQVGTRPEIDLVQEKTTRANTLVQSIQSENNYETAKAQLNQAMGIEADTDYDVEDVALSPVTGEDQQTDPLLAEALDARPDYRALLRDVKALSLTRDAVRGAYFPTLNLIGGISDVVARADPYVYSAFGALTLNWNLFSGFQTRSTDREASASLTGFEARADAQRLQIRLDVDQARLAVRSAKASLSASAEALLNAREQLRLAEGRYQTGVGSVIELGNAQVVLSSASAQGVQAEYTLSAARAQMVRALGRD